MNSVILWVGNVNLSPLPHSYSWGMVKLRMPLALISYPLYKLPLHRENVKSVHAADKDSIMTIDRDTTRTRELSVHIPTPTKSVKQLKIVTTVDVNFAVCVARHDNFSTTTGGNVGGVDDALDGFDGCGGDGAYGDDGSCSQKGKTRMQ